MNFNKVIIPSLSGRRRGYLLGNPFDIPNGNIHCKITICITTHALEYWYKKNYQNVPIDTEFALNEFSIKYIQNFRNLLIIALRMLIQHYKGFPSSIHLTEDLWLCFDVGNYLGSSEHISGDFKTVLISYNVDSLTRPQNHILGTIKHELLHIVAELHEGENNTVELIDKWHDKLNMAIEENKQTVTKGVDALLVYLKQESLGHREVTDLRVDSIESFYQYTQKEFWNMIADSALCVIAIELDDIEYIKACVEEERNLFFDFIKELSKIKNIMWHINENEIYEKKKSFFLALLKLLQFIICFENMPYQAIAYAILGDNWRPRMKKHFISNFLKSWYRNQSNKNIDVFKAIVKKYCVPQVAEGFLRFYDRYLDVVKAQAIHNDPLNPNITQQIHNTECLRRGKRAYIILNIEFRKLFKELKKYEE